MGSIMARKDQKGKYAAISAVLAVLLALWITMPLTERASLDGRMPVQFKGKTVNLKSLGVDVALEGQAPGGPVNGEVKGEASSLYNSGNADGVKFDEAQSASGGNAASGSAQKNADASVPAVPGSGSGSGSAPSAGAAGNKKLSSMAALGGSSAGGTSASGGTASKMFGSGSAALAVTSAGNAGKVDNAPSAGRGSAMLAALNKSAAFSQTAAKSGSDDSKGLASSAFDGNKAKALLGGKDEKTAASGGAALAGVNGNVSNLKDNDPALNSNKITPPSPTASAESSSSSMEQQIEKMVVQMALQYMLGAVFGAAGSAISSAMSSAMNSGANSAYSGGSNSGTKCVGGTKGC